MKNSSITPTFWIWRPHSTQLRRKFMVDKMEGKPELKAAAPEVAAQPKKKNNSRFLLIIVVAVLAIGGFITYLVLNPSLSTDNATVDRTKATVSTKMLGLIAH